MPMRKTEDLRAQYQISLLLYGVFLLLLAISFLLMPAASSRPGSVLALTLIAGLSFWIGLLGAVVMAFRLRAIAQRQALKKTTLPKEGKRGMNRLFPNREALIAAVVMVLSLLGGIPVWILASHSYWGFVFLSLLVLSLGAYGVLRAQGYNYYVKGDEK